MTPHILSRCWWRILRSIGLVGRSWDEQYATGLWVSRHRSPHTLARVAVLCHARRMIEFGCGMGELPGMMPAGTFSYYRGYDVSAKAIARATGRFGPAYERAHFVAQDMTKWSADQVRGPFDLILCEECLYYLRPRAVEAFLRECCKVLTPTGVILVVVHDARKHRATLEACRRVCRVVREEQVEERTYLTLGK